MKIFGLLFGMIFGLIFAVAGVFILFETSVSTYQSWQSMQSWKMGYATIVSTVNSSNNTEAVYQYRVTNHDYQNDRVYVSAFKDNIGSYHQDMFNQLNRLKSIGQPVAIWYDPDNPNDSVIDRNMRWGLFALTTGFCSVFILIGLIVCYSSITGTQKQQTEKRKPSYFELRKEWKQRQNKSADGESFMAFLQYRQNEYIRDKQANQIKKQFTQNEAWLTRKGWRDNAIRSSAKTSMIAMWGFTVVWIGATSPVLFFIDDEINKDNYTVLVALLFPLAGLFLLRHVWRMTREWLRFGVTELVMDPFPGAIGGHVGGSLELNNIHDYSASYKVELECIYSYVSGSGDNRSRRENVKWSEAGLARVGSATQGVRLNFRFDVPDDLPEADVEQKGDYIFWRLKVSADISGVDLKREYNIPVFKTGEKSREIRHDISAQVENAREQQVALTQTALDSGRLADTALSRAFRFKDTGHQISFYYPMFRNKLLIIIAMIFGGGFSFAAFSINSDFFSDGAWGIAMLLFSLPFALVGLFGSITAIYLSFNNLSVMLAGKKIKAVRRLLFFPVKHDVIDINEVKQMEVKSSGSTGQGTSKINHYKILVKTKSNQKITIAEDIDGKELAEQFKDFLYKRLSYSY